MIKNIEIVKKIFLYSPLQYKAYMAIGTLRIIMFSTV